MPAHGGAHAFSFRSRPAIDRRIIRWSKGKLTSGVGTTHKDNICLLFVRGAKTGQLRTVPLLGTPVDDAIVVIASNGGAPKHPAWYFNLRKHPECEVEVRGVRSHRVARVTAGAERERCWTAALALYPGYASYAERAGREIPVVVLERAPEA